MRATTVSQPDPQDATKVIPKKMFYLACSFCRWTSRDIGLPDQVTGDVSVYVHSAFLLASAHL